MHATKQLLLLQQTNISETEKQNLGSDIVYINVTAGMDLSKQMLTLPNSKYFVGKRSLYPIPFCQSQEVRYQIYK